VIAWAEVRYRDALQRSLGWPKFSYLLIAISAVAVVWLAVTVKREFLPGLDEGAIRVHVRLPPDTV
jgi:cobalt-zinc-cadmium resistance protein CzcA